MLLTDGLDLIVGESEHLVEFGTEDVVHLQVVQSRGVDHIGNLCDSCNHTEHERFVTLEDG